MKESFLFNAVDWAAFFWFLAMWVGYALYAWRKGKKARSLSAVMHDYRVDWVKSMMSRDSRILDITLLGNLTSMVTFFASTTIFVIAGAITILSSSDEVLALLSGHVFIEETTQGQVQFKLLVLVIIFVLVFFRFTWSMRQYMFCSVMFAAAPQVPVGTPLTVAQEEFALNAARISDRASHEFNYGLRAYYFSLAFLTWFISPWLLMLSSTVVVLVLYRREFRSEALDWLIKGRRGFSKV